MQQSSRLLAYFRGLAQGRAKNRRRGLGGYNSPKTQLAYMVGFMKGATERKAVGTK